MKKRVSLLLMIILCTLLCGCKETKTVDNIICIQNENIFYSSYEKQDTVLAFYRYNISENLTYKIGEIENPYINSGDIVAVDDSIFFYCNKVVSDSSDSEGKIESSLYQIDIAEDTLQKMAGDYVEQTLIYLNAADDSIISFKGKLNGSESITYLDIIDISDEENGDFSTLIYKEYDRDRKSGEIIYHFSIYDSMIYVMVGSRNSANDILWTIEKYSLSLNSKITNLINGERISKFEVFGEYGFIRNFSGSGVLFHISSDEISPILLKETDLDIAVPPDNAIDNYAIIYSRDTGEIWRLSIENSSLHKLNLPYEHLNYVFISNDNKVLISSDDIIYGELGQFPDENENLLIHQYG